MLAWSGCGAFIEVQSCIWNRSTQPGRFNAEPGSKDGDLRTAKIWYQAADLMLGQNHFVEPNRHVLTFRQPIFICRFTYRSWVELLWMCSHFVPIEFSIKVPQDVPYSSALLSNTFIYIYINRKGGPKEEATFYFYFGEWVKILNIFHFFSLNLTISKQNSTICSIGFLWNHFHFHSF
jgi:hypothetical protein